MQPDEAVEIIKGIAERHERNMAVCEMARRIERDRRNTIHAATAESCRSGGDETLPLRWVNLAMRSLR
jgi:hypothetical protein